MRDTPDVLRKELYNMIDSPTHSRYLLFLEKNSAPISRVLYSTLRQSVCHLSNPQVTLRLKHSTLHRAMLGRTALKRWYTRTCSLRTGQPDDHPPAGGLLHHLLTLTPCGAVLFFSRIQPSPTACTFTSEVSYAARTFLSHPPRMPATDRGTAFSLQSYKKSL